MSRETAARKPVAHGSETDLVRNVLMAICRLERDCYAWRNNTGAIKRGSRFIRYGSVGSPDILCIVGGRFLGLECKTDDGAQSADQIGWQHDCELAGGAYFVVRSVADARAAIRKVRDEQR